MLEKIQPNRVFYFFEEMNKIPRNSGDEKAVSDWICQWAKSIGLEVSQDKIWNLVIKKNPSKGLEASKPIILQAHMDMVCEKTTESNHNFTKDPVKLKVDGDWVLSDCGTSIGADNGIGVAFAMAILEDENLKHPPLEVIFTVQEESTFDGAGTISADLFQGKRMINLDHAVDNQVLAGSCGGSGIDFTLPLIYEESAGTGKTCYRIVVKGLKGGHSGEDIHRGRGNAIELLNRILRDESIEVCSIKGGTFRLAIPREAEAVVRIASSDAQRLKDKIALWKEIFYKEYGQIAPDIDVTIVQTDLSSPLQQKDKNKVIQILDLFPNGIMKMNGAIPGVVESSINLGTVDVSDEKLLITAEARGAYSSTVGDIKDKVDSLAALTGGQAKYYGQYVPWEYNHESNLRLTAQKVYKDAFCEDLETVVVHAGIECGMFIEKVPEMDAISIGPYCEFFHSPNERISIKSTAKTYKFLTKLLEELN